MKNIIVPTDFSKNVGLALDFAIKNFNGPNTCFWLTHVYRMPYSGAVLSMDLDDLLKDKREEELKDQLNAAREVYPNLNITGQAVQGLFVDVISKIVEKESIDMIVMGTTGETEARGILLGSNATAIVKHATVPVLLVPNDYDVVPMETILFASDLKHVKGLETLKPLRQIIKDADASLEILHLDGSDDVQADEERESLLLDTIFADLPHNFTVRPLTQIEEDILDFASEIEADLIVVVARNYGFFERLIHRSTSKKLSKLTQVPLLVLREKS